jgi:hypothetical protein
MHLQLLQRRCLAVLRHLPLDVGDDGVDLRRDGRGGGEVNADSAVDTGSDVGRGLGTQRRHVCLHLCAGPPG